MYDSEILIFSKVTSEMVSIEDTLFQPPVITHHILYVALPNACNKSNFMLHLFHFLNIVWKALKGQIVCKIPLIP